MKILIVMGGFFPGKKYGGPPVSVDNFCSLLSNEDFYILTSDHDLGERTRYQGIKKGWNERGTCKVQYLEDKEYNRFTFEKVITEIKPDVLYLQGLFQSCVLPCLYLAKKYNMRVLLAPRGELCNGAINIRKWKKVPYIGIMHLLGLLKDVHFQSTSEEETNAIRHWLKARDNYIHFLPNIPTISNKTFSRLQKNAGEARFIFLSRIHPKKNLLSAIKYFNRIQGKVRFDIYGPIEDELYWKLCQEEIVKLPKNIQVKYEGIVEHEEVHEILSRYDAFLFPTLSENYGHVIAESLFVGTPVITSDQTPWLDLALHNAGWAIALTNQEQFIRNIQRIVDNTDKEQTDMRKKAKQYFIDKLKIEKIKNRYEHVLEYVVRR